MHACVFISITGVLAAVMKIPEWVVYEPQNLFLTILEMESGDQYAIRSRYLVRPASWFIDGRLLPVSPHGEKMEGTP